jgi:hypothetical protein
MLYKSILFTLALSTLSFAQTTNVWFRIDGDQQGHIFWVGGQNGLWTHDFIFYPGPGWVEADFGRLVTISEGNDLQPMIGLQHDPIVGRLNYIVPQLFWFSNSGRHSSELWALYYLRTTKALSDYSWLLFQERYELNSIIRAGPQFESFYDFTAKADIGTYAGFGIKLNYGAKSSLDVSISKDLNRDRGVARLTFMTFLD